MAKRYSHLSDEYRAKIPFKMNEAFLAEASASVVHMVDTGIETTQEQTKTSKEGIITSKPHLRLL